MSHPCEYSPYTQISKNIEQLIDDAEDKLDLSLLGMLQKQQHKSPPIQQPAPQANNHTTKPAMKRSCSMVDVPTRSLFIGNLDPTVSEEDLQQTFSQFGKIESLRLLPNKECAFVNFTNVDEAVQAKAAMVGRPIGHLIPRIGFGKVSCNSSSNAVQAASDTPSVSRSVWVGQMSSTVTKEALLTAFIKFGPIETVRITGNRSCAFVDFCSLESAIKAKNSMNGVKLAGSIIKTGYAKGLTKPPMMTKSPTNSSSNKSSKRMWMSAPVSEDVIDYAGEEREEDNTYNPVNSPMNNERYDLPLTEPPRSETENIIGEEIMQRLKELTELECIGTAELEGIVMPNAMKLAWDVNGNILVQRIIERLDMSGFRKIFDLFYPHFLDLAIGNLACIIIVLL